MVIVTLTYSVGGRERSYDLELPCQVPARILVTHICQTLSGYTKETVMPLGLQLWCRRLGRALSPEETAEDAGIWNGDHIDMK